MEISLLTAFFFCLLVTPAVAGSATWNLNPTSSDWNTAANWTPATVPSGLNDIATFAVSNTTSVSPSDRVQVRGINFVAGASAFTITIIAQRSFTFIGGGITNDSGVIQNFVTEVVPSDVGSVAFTGNATAGNMVAFTNNSTVNGHDGGDGNDLTLTVVK